MAQSQSADEPQKEVQKKVTIVGYLDDSKFATPRHWAQIYDDSRDYFRKTTSRSVTRKLRGPGVDKILSEDAYEELSKIDTGDLELVKNVRTDRKYKRRPSWAARTLLREFLDEIIDPLMEGLEYKSSMTKWVDENGDMVCRANRQTDMLQMLKHKSEMSEADPFVDDDTEYPVIKFTLKMTGLSKGQVSVMERRLVEPMMKMVGRHSDFTRVRMLDCETSVQESGVCFRV